MEARIQLRHRHGNLLAYWVASNCDLVGLDEDEDWVTQQVGRHEDLALSLITLPCADLLQLGAIEESRNCLLYLLEIIEEAVVGRVGRYEHADLRLGPLVGLGRIAGEFGDQFELCIFSRRVRLARLVLQFLLAVVLVVPRLEVLVLEG